MIFKTQPRCRGQKNNNKAGDKYGKTKHRQEETALINTKGAGHRKPAPLHYEQTGEK